MARARLAVDHDVAGRGEQQIEERDPHQFLLPDHHGALVRQRAEAGDVERALVIEQHDARYRGIQVRAPLDAQPDAGAAQHAPRDQARDIAVQSPVAPAKRRHEDCRGAGEEKPQSDERGLEQCHVSPIRPDRAAGAAGRRMVPQRTSSRHARSPVTRAPRSAARWYSPPMDVLEAGSGPLYRAVKLASTAAVNAYFGRLEVGHAERVPARGPVLVVANHPSSLTDVLILGVALPRRLHFLAHSGLFRPWIRGLALRVMGALPMYRREDAPEESFRNDDTFRACHAFFDRGGVVVIFPEGTSQTDRQVQRLKTGAARLALGYDAMPGRADRLVVLPVGLHFVARTAFRSDVVVSIGRPFALDAYQAVPDPADAVRALTAAMQGAIEKLILHVPRAELAGLVRDLEHLYLEDLTAALPPAPELMLSRGLADSVQYFAEHDPEQLYRVWRRVAAYKRRLAALDLRDQTVRQRVPTGLMVRTSARVLVAGSLGAAPALAGAAVHILPYRVTGFVSKVVAGDATHIAFARIVLGALLFPLTYAGWAWLAARHLHWTGREIGAALAACVPLGFFALAYFRWIKRERHRLWFAWLAMTHRRQVARVRAERRSLMRLLDAARDAFLAAHHLPPADRTP